MTRRYGTLAAASAAVTLIVSLSGCAAPAADIDAGASELMQTTVMATADQAAAGDSAGALATLDTLQTQLQQAIDAGDITAARAVAVQRSIDLVRADLAPEPSVAPTPETSPDPVPAVEPVTPDPPAPAEKGEKGEKEDKGNKGEGNNGNGNGKDKNE